MSDCLEISQRDAVDRIAREWISTPFHDNAQVKGLQGGVDCARLLQRVYVEAGVIEDYKIDHYSPQHFLHGDEEKFLGYVLRDAREIPLEKVLHGDAVLYHVGKVFAHGAIVIRPGWPHVVHAHFASQCVVRGSGVAMHLGTPIKAVRYFTMW